MTFVHELCYDGGVFCGEERGQGGREEWEERMCFKCLHAYLFVFLFMYICMS